jgi:hypothetical protein
VVYWELLVFYFQLNHSKKQEKKTGTSKKLTGEIKMISKIKDAIEMKQ